MFSKSSISLVIFTVLLAPLAFGAGGGGKLQYGSKSVAIASSFQDKMQCAVKEIEQKYKPKDIGCFGSRPNNASAHPTGHACDVDQTGRNIAAINKVVKDPEQIALSKKCGIVSGCQWRNKDCGHFEAMGKEGYVGAGGGHRYSGYSGHQTPKRRR